MITYIDYDFVVEESRVRNGMAFSLLWRFYGLFGKS